MMDDNDIIPEQEKDVLLFGPRNGKALLSQYPELAEEPEFKDLRNDDLLFAWYFGNRSSPIDPDMGETVKAVLAAKYSFPKDEDERKNYGDLQIPERVKKAIKKMSSYSPDTRMVAKRMVQSMFSNLQKMVEVDEDQFKYADKEGGERIDWTAKKQYVDSCAKISETLPALIKQLEDGFGITVKSGEETMPGVKRFHQRKKDS